MCHVLFRANSTTLYRNGNDIIINIWLQARSKLPKRRRRVLPVEQPRRKREVPVAANRRMNALKHQPTHPTASPAIFKDAFGSAKIGMKAPDIAKAFRNEFHRFLMLAVKQIAGHVNGVNVIGLSLHGPSVPLAVIRSPSASHSGLPTTVTAAGVADVMLPLQPKLLLPVGAAGEWF